MPDKPSPTIQETIDDYISIRTQRYEQTGRTYRYALRKYSLVLKDNGLDPEHSPIESLSEDTIPWLIDALRELSQATETLYLDAARDLFRHIEVEELRPVNMERIRRFIKMRSRKRGRRLPSFPKKDIDKLLELVVDYKIPDTDKPAKLLQNLRDRALILTLADTGLRIHEACYLLRGSIDYDTGQAMITGKGNKDAVIRFSPRSLQAIREYLSARTPLLDGNTGKPLASLPLFARHDKGAGKKVVKRMSTRTGDNILNNRVKQFLGPGAVGTITPHSLRHWFVTQILQKTNNLKLAKELARHENMDITQRYAHIQDEELDSAYNRIFSS